MIKSIQDFFLQKTSRWEIGAMVLFVFFVTGQPYFMQHEIIMMETGIHLPAINALFHGLIPYRDFFYLRGAFELYVPALMMKIGGINSAILPVFYYGGTILTLILAVILAGLFFRTRLIFFTMAPVFVALTFPRVSFYYWGGMRYALGFLMLLTLFYFLKTNHRRWIFGCGIVCALSLLTTIEAGVSTTIAVVAGLLALGFCPDIDRKKLLQAFGIFCLGFAVICFPYFIYLLVTGSLIPFIRDTYVVVAISNNSFPGQPGLKPENLAQFLHACIPGTKFFRYMTPLWCYVFFTTFVVFQLKKRRLNWEHAFLVGLMFYGLVLYAAAFRKIEGHHFEMALQAEKFVYFFLIESALLLTISRRWPWGYYLALVFLVLSLAYALDRFNHRFTMIKYIEKQVFHQRKVKGLSLLEGEPTALLTMDRARGHVVPQWQADEINGVTEFLQTHTKPNEPVFCYPEVGNFNFWADRPFIGRFPITTFSWFYEPWYQEMFNDFKKAQPHYVVMTHVGHRTFPSGWYFRNPRNKERFDEMTNLILSNYKLVESFESVGIYEHK